MAKVAKPVDEQPKKTDMISTPTPKQDDYVTFDFRGLTLPWAIILSVFVFTAGIGAAIYFGLSAQKTVTTTSTTTTPTTAADDTNPTTFAAASIPAVDDPVFGGDKTTAKVVIVEFSDFVCPYCQKFHQEAYQDIKRDYIDTGKVAIVYRFYPLGIHEPAATIAAKAGICINSLYGLSSFIKYHDAFFNSLGGITQNAYTAQNQPSVTMKDTQFYSMISALKISGYDKNSLNDCMASQAPKDILARDAKAFDDYSTSAGGGLGTPLFIIGKMDNKGVVVGRTIDGAYPYASFKAVIDEQLAK